MGGGEFEYNPNTLEEKINQRQEYLKNEVDTTIELINNRALKYTELGLGSIEGYKEYVLKKLIEDFRGV